MATSDDDKGLSIAEVMSLGDVVLSFENDGAKVMGILRVGEDRYKAVPVEVDVQYDGNRDRSGGQIRKITMKAGWTQKQWDAIVAADEARAVREEGDEHGD